MKLAVFLIFFVLVNYDGVSQQRENSINASLILKKYINNGNCYQSKRHFYGCIALISQLKKIRSTALFLAQKSNDEFYLISGYKKSNDKHYKINFFSKYFVKSLIEDFYHQEQKVSFRKLLLSSSLIMTEGELLRLMNEYYALRYDFHSYLSFSTTNRDYSLPLVLKKVKGGAAVQFVFPYTAASYQQIQKGDMITKINGVSTNSLSEQELRAIWSKEKSSFVTLEVLRNTQSWKVYFTTTEFKTQSKVINPSTIYYRIATINNQAEEVITQSLKNSHVDNVILDLRSVDGGYVKSALEIAALFMKRDPWVRLHNIKTSEKPLIEVSSKVTKTYKVIILVDEETKSAAEMLAGLVAISEKALLIGRNTYGKGSVQKPSSWKFRPSIQEWKTFAFYRLPEWGKVQKYGLEVDIKIGKENFYGLREKDYYLSLTDTGLEVNDYLKYPLRRSLLRGAEIDCAEDSLKASRWPKYSKGKDKALQAAISSLDCL